jgi:hypothetical protein
MPANGPPPSARIAASSNPTDYTSIEPTSELNPADRQSLESTAGQSSSADHLRDTDVGPSPPRAAHTTLRGLCPLVRGGSTAGESSLPVHLRDTAISPSPPCASHPALRGPSPLARRGSSDMEVDTQETLPQRLTNAATKLQTPECVQMSANSRERSHPPGDRSDATRTSPRSDVERVDPMDLAHGMDSMKLSSRRG